MTTKPNRRRFLGAIGTATVAGLAGCSAGAKTGQDASPTEVESRPTAGPTTAGPDPSTDTPGRAKAAAGAQVDVQMITDNKGSYFDPKGLLVEPGTTIRFINVSGSHTATAYHPDNDGQPRRIPEGVTPWDSGLYTEPDETFEVTLETAGVSDYYCTPHEMLGMVGRIIVGGPQGGPGTTPPESLPPGARESLPSIESILDEEVVNGP